MKLLRLFIGCAALAFSLATADAQQGKPNFIVVFCDDLGYAQIGKTFGISRMSVYRRLKGHIEAKKESEIHCINNQKS